MLKGLVILMMSISFMSASSSATAGAIPDITMTWAGIAALVIFVIGYYFVAMEEKYHIDKAKPALFAGTFIFMSITEITSTSTATGVIGQY